MKYYFYWGNTVPFSRQEAATWKEVCILIKAILIEGFDVHSVGIINKD